MIARRLSLFPFYVVVAVSLAAILGACTGPLLPSLPPRGGGAPVSAGEYKVGNPYKVAGVWYHPAEDPGYNQVGIASWYGRDFHGRRTANGAVYDMNALSAAHTTLPMPSLVRVTNLENRRSVVLTVNDRGPFVRGRIIDVSRRGAQLLGFMSKGTARVRVEAVRGAASGPMISIAGSDRAGAAPFGSGAAPPAYSVAPPAYSVAQPAYAGAQAAYPPASTAITQEPLAPPPGVVGRSAAESFGAQSSGAQSFGAQSSGAQPSGAYSPGAFESVVIEPAAGGLPSVYIQAGAFSDLGNAQRVGAQLARLGRTTLTWVQVGERKFYRVRLGPITDTANADAMLREVIAAGHRDARLVTD